MFRNLFHLELRGLPAWAQLSDRFKSNTGSSIYHIEEIFNEAESQFSSINGLVIRLSVSVMVNFMST